jgi:hypothetical protein
MLTQKSLFNKSQNLHWTSFSWAFVSHGIDNCPVSLVSWVGVGLSTLGTLATNWPNVPAPYGRWWVWSSRWNDNWRGNPKYSEKTCLSVTLSATNPTWPDLGFNWGHHGGKPVTNLLSYGTANYPISRCEKVFKESWVELEVAGSFSSSRFPQFIKRGDVPALWSTLIAYLFVGYRVSWFVVSCSQFSVFSVIKLA